MMSLLCCMWLDAYSQAMLALLGRNLEVVEAELCDLEITGVPALQYFGQCVWK